MVFKRILVPVDGSLYSRHAVAIAVEMGRKFDSEVEIFYTAAAPDNTWMSGESNRQAGDASTVGQEVIETTIKGVDLSGVKITKKTLTGKPAETILKEIRRDFELVVMGTRGHGQLSGVVIGSVTQRVMAECPCPVLVVK